MVGVKPGKLDEKVQSLLPGYMTMGDTGMGDMAEMGMAVPKNSIPMVGGPGPFGYIDMGGMFTVVEGAERHRQLRRPRLVQAPAGHGGRGGDGGGAEAGWDWGGRIKFEFRHSNFGLSF